MENNVFYLSDASYDPTSQIAIYAIKNMISGHYETGMIKNVCSILEAEEFAMLYAIEHAIHSQHYNCVFVYDAINIDTARIAKFYDSFFEKIQFLWCKRHFLKDVDNLVNRRKRLIEKTDKKKHTFALITMKDAEKLTDKEIVKLLLFLTQGETYRKLCIFIGVRAMADVYNKKNDYTHVALSLIYSLLSKKGKKALSGQFNVSDIQIFKRKTYDGMLEKAGFSLTMVDDIIKNQSVDRSYQYWV